MNGTSAAASASIWLTVLPPVMLVRSASVRCVGAARFSSRIIRVNSARSRFWSREFSAISAPMLECDRPL
ncbi:MAG: hypothetical protein WDN69_10310 [Aliidongia sp.]